MFDKKRVSLKKNTILFNSPLLLRIRGLKNKNMRRYLILFIVVQFVNISCAQDKVLLLSGEQKNNIKIDSMSMEYLYYSNLKGKSKQVDMVYSITRNQNDSIIYKQDSTLAYDLNAEQMNFFLKGEMDAIANYSSKGNALGSIIIGGLSGAMSFWGIPIPVVYSLGINTINPSMKNANKDLLDNEYYVNGYKGKAKSKRLKNSLICGFSSFVVVAIILGL